MNIREITPRISYVGVNDRSKHLFENLWPLPQGVSYNSYVVRGSEKVALVDTAPVESLAEYFGNIDRMVGDTPINYLIVNHMEPDHSGLMAQVRERYPQIRFVVNKVTLPMAKGFSHITDDDAYLVVGDGDTLSLGDITLRFATIPMVHWPETMVTLAVEDSVLFTCDALGCFGALPGGVIDTEMVTDRFFPEMERYYATIVAKYAPFVQKALAKVATLPAPAFVCPSHGPVWHDRIADVIAVYDRLSSWRGDDGVVMVYGSMYGNTARLADRIAASLAEEGVRNIIMHDLAVADKSVVIRDIVKYKGLIVGSPTYNMELYPPVAQILDSIRQRGVKNRVYACFGSYAWASMADKKMQTFAEEMKWEVAASMSMPQGGNGQTASDVASFARDYVAAYGK